MLANPFEKIGLCLSGGGYRAAVFHLGTMAYLQRCTFQGSPLLDRVQALSTVSGGTITGVVWALKKRQGAHFQETYDFLLNQLRQLDLVAESLQKLQPGGQWDNPRKSKNLINAFAERYDQALTKGATFEIFNDKKSSPEVLVFNATEFSQGISFRFQNRGLFGNRYFPIPKEAKGEIKLADIIAASSCFPGGFEPMKFPQDFCHGHSPSLDGLSLQARFRPPIGLMDGGINDNQGIDSLLKRIRQQDYSLIVVSDVSSPYMAPFVPHNPQPQDGVRSLSGKGVLEHYRRWRSGVLAGLLVWMLLGLMFLVMGGFSNNFTSGTGTALLLSGLLLTGGFLLLRQRLERKARRFVTYLGNFIPLFYRQRLAELQLGRLTLGRLEPLLLDRIFSLQVLVSNVFLKSLRREAYAKLYENENLQPRSITSVIRGLTEKDFYRSGRRCQRLAQCPPELRGNYQQVVGPHIQQLIESAASFGTTLWFTEQDHLNDTLGKLVEAGKISMCYQLLNWLLVYMWGTERGFSQLSPELQQEVRQLYERCLADWSHYKKWGRFAD